MPVQISRNRAELSFGRPLEEVSQSCRRRFGKSREFAAWAGKLIVKGCRPNDSGRNGYRVSVHSPPLGRGLQLRDRAGVYAPYAAVCGGGEHVGWIVTRVLMFCYADVAFALI